MCGGYATTPAMDTAGAGVLDPIETAEQERAFGRKDVAADLPYAYAHQAKEAEQVRQGTADDYWRMRAEEAQRLIPAGEWDNFVRWVASGFDNTTTYERDTVRAAQQFLHDRVVELKNEREGAIARTIAVLTERHQEIADLKTQAGMVQAILGETATLLQRTADAL